MTKNEQSNTRVERWAEYRQEIISTFTKKQPPKEKEKKTAILKPVKESVKASKLLGEYEKTKAEPVEHHEIDERQPVKTTLVFLILIIVLVLVAVIFFWKR